MGSIKPIMTERAAAIQTGERRHVPPASNLCFPARRTGQFFSRIKAAEQTLDKKRTAQSTSRRPSPGGNEGWEAKVV